MDRDCIMAENLAKKIYGGHRALATRMVNTVGEMITTFEGVPTSELDVKWLLQLKLNFLGETDYY